MVVVDLVAVRAAVGDDRERLAEVVALALPRLDGPVEAALDLDAVTEVAAVRDPGERALALVRTTQSPEEVVDALIEAGYEEDGELVIAYGRDDDDGYPIAAAIDDDVLLLAGERDRAQRSVDGTGGPPDVAELIEDLVSPVLVATTGFDRDRCGENVALTWSVAPSEGEVVARVGALPSASRLRPAADVDDAEGFEVEPPRLEDGLLRAGYRFDADATDLGVDHLFDQLPGPVSRLYDCPAP